jgi:hypothetical protein
VHVERTAASAEIIKSNTTSVCKLSYYKIVTKELKKLTRILHTQNTVLRNGTNRGRSMLQATRLGAVHYSRVEYCQNGVIPEVQEFHK